MSKIIAINSNQDIVLDIRKDKNDEYHFCLFGEYNGEYLQIDFDNMTEKEYKQFLNKCINLLKQKENK